ncbi:MAG: Gfo/Idh/MocA family oxidoreductase [Candidatus Hydrogenedentes bacterium]|nr:Gfo/Idh/MocA family oxidoreductase [Candidatus Hydrogenedentota bacterium]
MNRYRWGILGTGAIANQFAEGLRAVADAELAAVGSRNQATADAFAAKWGVPRAHASYDALADDPDIDIIYIATPHPLHAENSILALQSGKAVLCEKPFTVNAAQANALITVARGEGRFLMEAMWSRFHPVMDDIRRWLEEGAIGEPRMLQADFGFRADPQETPRLLDAGLAGGSLLDVGVYPISLASMIFGTQPPHIATEAAISGYGTDEQAACIFRYESGALALLSSAVLTETPWEAVIMGTEGWIRIDRPFWNPGRATLERPGHDPVVAEPPRTGNGYNYEAAAVQACLADGNLEHPLMPLDESLAIMETLDRIRAAWGMRYPGE